MTSDQYNSMAKHGGMLPVWQHTIVYRVALQIRVDFLTNDCEQPGRLSWRDSGVLI
jgi:hypothetical protein